MFDSVLKTVVGLIVLAIIAIVGYLILSHLPSAVLIGIAVVAGITAGACVCLLIAMLVSPFLKGLFANNPNNLNPLQHYVAVDENRAVVIERAGNPLRVIHGGEETGSIEPIKKVRAPIFGETLYKLFVWYEKYVYNINGHYAYVPFFTTPKIMPLPRYEIKQVDGRNVYVPIQPGDGKYFTNHVRTSLTTWYFEYKGIDIQGIPFTIFGSIQYSIDQNKVREAFYKTDAWNVLLDQASNSVIRRQVRGTATIEGVIGRVEQDLWGEPNNTVDEELLGKLSSDCLDSLLNYEFKSHEGPIKLEDVGINLHGVLFNDFDPELTKPEELEKLRSPALKQRQGRGEYHLGSAVSENQQKLVEVHGKESSKNIIDGEALVRATRDGGGVLEALATSFIQKQRGD